MANKNLLPKPSHNAHGVLKILGTKNIPFQSDPGTGAHESDPPTPSWWPTVDAEMKEVEGAEEKLFTCYAQNGGKEVASSDPDLCSREKGNVRKADERLMRATTPKP